MVWIEIGLEHLVVRYVDVTTLRVVWIEILQVQDQDPDPVRHHLAGGVD